MSGECCLSSNQVRPTRPAGSHPNFQSGHSSEPETALHGGHVWFAADRYARQGLVTQACRHPAKIPFPCPGSFPSECFNLSSGLEKRKLHFMSLNLSYSFTSKFHKFQPVPQDRGSLDIHRRVKHPVPKSLFRGVVETKLVFFITISEAFRSSSIYVYPFGTYGRRRVGASSTQKTCNLIMFSVL